MPERDVNEHLRILTNAVWDLARAVRVIVDKPGTGGHIPLVRAELEKAEAELARLDE